MSPLRLRFFVEYAPRSLPRGFFFCTPAIDIHPRVRRFVFLVEKAGTICRDCCVNHAEKFLVWCVWRVLKKEKGPFLHQSGGKFEEENYTPPVCGVF